MKTLKRVLGEALILYFIFVFVGPIAAHAATTPSLGAAATYGVLGGTYTNTVAGTTINGDVGYTTGPATVPTVNGTIYGAGAPTPTARTDAATALTNLNSQACTFSFASGAIDLAADTTHGSLGVYTPGVYCTTGAGAASIGTAGITLSGSGTYIFRVNGALTTVANSNVTLSGGASAFDVFWTPIAATTLGANTTFRGTIIDNANAITAGAGTVWIGRALSLGAGTITTDTNTITAPSTLRVIKTVVNDNGGTSVAANFNLHVKLSGTDVSGSPAVGVVSPGTSYSLLAGTYVVSEDANASYAQSFSGDCNSSGSVTLSAGQDKTCTITNDDIAPALHLRKTVINDNGGTALNTAWTLTATGTGGSPTNLTGATPIDSGATFKADTYTLTESGGPSGYTASTYSCIKNGGGAVINNSITLAVSDNATCTITNDDIAPKLTVTKVVVNDSGGIKVISQFPLFIDGGSVTSGVANTTTVGLHTVSETSDSGYTSVIGGNCAANGTITLALGDVKTCTITNDDIAPVVIPPATLRIIKTVVNNSGGVAIASGFNLHVKLSGTDVSGSPAVGVVSPGTSYSLLAGTYVVSEDANTGYVAAFSGDCNLSGSVTLASGDSKTCTITNDDIAPVVIPPVVLPASINVVKIVINDNGRTKTVIDFPLFVSGTPVTSGVTNVFPAPATYTVTETVDPNYTQTFSGDCAAGGTINLTPGDNRFCIITNNDIAAPVIAAAPSSTGGSGSIQAPPVPPLIDVVKVPIPLALPAGPGPVTYTYTLRNVGTVSVANITMVGDTCRPIILVSGDSNADTRLDVNETWIYTCSTTLTKTHTNIVTATGWANGISAVDIASATVVVGLPIVPPLIHVTKIPSPLALAATGGIVTYTNKVTNPGIVALENVRLVDDKCSPVKYISGDSNRDLKLDSSETWIYTCQAKLVETTTNTVIAQGDASGLTARDFAIATVVVAAAVPKFPNTGVAPDEKSAPWNIVVLVGILMLVSSSFVVAFKKSMR